MSFNLYLDASKRWNYTAHCVMQSWTIRDNLLFLKNSLLCIFNDKHFVVINLSMPFRHTTFVCEGYNVQHILYVKRFVSMAATGYAKRTSLMCDS